MGDTSESLGANKGGFFDKHFSKVNKILRDNNIEEINDLK